MNIHPYILPVAAAIFIGSCVVTLYVLLSSRFKIPVTGLIPLSLGGYYAGEASKAGLPLNGTILLGVFGFLFGAMLGSVVCTVLLLLARLLTGRSLDTLVAMGWDRWRPGFVTADRLEQLTFESKELPTVRFHLTHANQEVAALTAETARLRGKIADAHGNLENCRSEITVLREQRDRAHAELDKTRDDWLADKENHAQELSKLRACHASVVGTLEEARNELRKSFAEAGDRDERVKLAENAAKIAQHRAEIADERYAEEQSRAESYRNTAVSLGLLPGVVALTSLDGSVKGYTHALVTWPRGASNPVARGFRSKPDHRAVQAFHRRHADADDLRILGDL